MSSALSRREQLELWRLKKKQERTRKQPGAAAAAAGRTDKPAKVARPAALAPRDDKENAANGAAETAVDLVAFLEEQVVAAKGGDCASARAALEAHGKAHPGALRATPFWIARAAVEEAAGDTAAVVAVFERACDHNAEPLGLLEEALGHFLKRSNIQEPERPAAKRPAAPVEVADKKPAGALDVPKKKKADAPKRSTVPMESSPVPLPLGRPGRVPTTPGRPMSAKTARPRLFSPPIKGRAERVPAEEPVQQRAPTPQQQQQPVAFVSEKDLGSVVMLDTLRATPGQREQFGADSLLSPVRRSARTRSGKVSAVKSAREQLAETGYAFAANPSVMMTPTFVDRYLVQQAPDTGMSIAASPPIEGRLSSVFDQAPRSCAAENNVHDHQIRSECGDINDRRGGESMCAEDSPTPALHNIVRALDMGETPVKRKAPRALIDQLGVESDNDEPDALAETQNGLTPLRRSKRLRNK